MYAEEGDDILLE